jgi:hypothetical protein
MTKYHYREEPSSITGTVFRPIADIVLEANENRIEAALYIDSGADVTMIPFRFGKALGFIQESGDEILEIKGVSGAGVPYLLKTATLILNGKRLPIRLAWALIEEVPLLLGRLDIFRNFKITFDEKLGVITFKSR